MRLGRSWRSGAVAEQRYLKQWFLRITEYADELLEGEGVGTGCGHDNRMVWSESSRTRWGRSDASPVLECPAYGALPFGEGNRDFVPL